MFKKPNPRMLTACAIAFLTVAVAQPTQAEDWSYRADLGGWLDNETGLVWGPSCVVWQDSNYSLDAAKFACNTYSQITGISGWRLPTLTEAKSAMAHNCGAYFGPTWNDGDPISWTSTGEKQNGKSKKYWAVRFYSGITQLIGDGSFIKFRVVRQP